MYKTIEEINQRIEVLDGKMKNTTDSFFIYGYVKEKEELQRKLKELKP